MTNKEAYIKFHGFTEEEYEEYKKESEIVPHTPEESYRHLLAPAKYWRLSEEQFLRVYHAEGEDAKREYAKLSQEQKAWFGHLCVAYRLLLRERGELKD